MPIKTTERKKTINQLFIKIKVSLLNQYILFSKIFSSVSKKKKIKIEIKININKNIKINTPRSGSLAKVCTEFNIPDLTKNVPLILNENVAIDKIKVQDFKINLFSRTEMECSSAVRQNQGISETFSTGSQNQNPPHPSS